MAIVRVNGSSFDMTTLGSEDSAHLLTELRIVGRLRILRIRISLLHVGRYTRDQFDRVSHNETSKHTDYCRVSLRAANDVVRPKDSAVRPSRSVKSIFTSHRFFRHGPEWIERETLAPLIVSVISNVHQLSVSTRKPSSEVAPSISAIF